MPHLLRAFSLVSALAFLAVIPAACGPGDRPGDPDGGNGDGSTTPPPEVSASPTGGMHEGALVVTLESDRAATIRWTVDGSDPATSETAQSGPSPRTVLIEPPATVELRFLAVDGELKSDVVTETYTVVERLNPASISGTVVLHERLNSGRVVVGIFDKDPIANTNINPVDTTSINVGQQNTYGFQFEGLPGGEYWVLGVWWPMNPPVDDPHAIVTAFANPISLDPNVDGQKRADFVELHVGRCDPKSPAAIHGTLELPGHHLGNTAAVLVYPKALTLATFEQDPINAAISLGTGAERPYALCDLVPGDVYLYAVALNENGTPLDVVSWRNNPVEVSGVHTAALNLGVPDSALGTLTVSFDFGRPPADTEQLQAILVKGSTLGADSPIAAAKLLPKSGSSTYSFQFTGLGEGSYRVAVILVQDGQPSPFPMLLPETVEIAFPDKKDVQLEF